MVDDGFGSKQPEMMAWLMPPPLLGMTNPAASPTASVVPSTICFTGPPSESSHRRMKRFPNSGRRKIARVTFEIAFELPTLTPKPTLAKFGPFGMIHA